MNRALRPRLVLSLGLLASLPLASTPSGSQPSTANALTEIQHTPSPCMDTEEFPLIEARASSANVARLFGGLTLRFKAENEDSWYETTFRSPSGASFSAALPKPRVEAARVVYYFTTSDHRRRTEEFVVPVLMGGCPGARAAPSSLSDAIRVRVTEDDQNPVPTGFSPEGVNTGGSMSGTTLGIVAAAGVGAGLAALANTGDEAPPAGGGGNPSNPIAIRACFAPDPIPEISSGETILFDATCTTPATVTSYQWSFGDGTPNSQGSNVEHLFRPGGTYTVRLTASEGSRSDSTSRVVQVRATPSACFITNPDPPRIGANESINFNAECSEGDRDGGGAAIVRYDWDFGDGRPGAEGVFVSRQFAAPDVYGVRLTVTNADGFLDSNTQFVVVENRATATSESGTRPQKRTSRLRSELILPEPQGVRARVSVNESTAVIVGATPAPLRFEGRSGDNVLEGRIAAGESRPGRWRLSFGAGPPFVAGSIRVEAGDVLARDATSVVFRLSGKPGQIVRFRFRLED